MELIMYSFWHNYFFILLLFLLLATSFDLKRPSAGQLEDIPLCLKYNIKMEWIMYSFWHNYFFYFIIISIIGC
jgi:hypothetical protein